MTAAEEMRAQMKRMLLAAVAVLASIGSAQAQGYPSKPITVVMPEKKTARPVVLRTWMMSLPVR